MLLTITILCGGFALIALGAAFFVDWALKQIRAVIDESMKSNKEILAALQATGENE